MIQFVGVVVGLSFKGFIMALEGIVTSVAILAKRASQFFATNNAFALFFLDLPTKWLEGTVKKKLQERNLQIIS